tara:strand:+ start:11959 stop:13623 length:1665 start_codon:yes stop_codon:yes gene_type:complete
MPKKAQPRQLSVKTLYTLLVISYLTLLFVWLAGFRYWVSYPADMAMAAAQQQRGIESLAQALSLAQEQLQIMTNDHAQWDYSWDFIHSSHDTNDNLSANFIVSTFASLSLNGVMILDSTQTLRAGYRYSNGQLEHYSGTTDHLLPPILQTVLLGSTPATAMTLIDGFPTMIAANPISRSDGTGEGVGWMVFMKRLNNTMLGDFERITRLNIATVAITDPALGFDEPVTSAMISAIRCLQDPFEQPVYCLKITDPDLSLPHLLNMNTLQEMLIIGAIPASLFSIILHLIITPLKVANSHLLRNLKFGHLKELPLTQSFYITEIAQLANSYNQLVATIRDQNQRLEVLSHTDALTGVRNRRGFDRMQERAWYRLCRNPLSMALIMIDIDYFKLYNDRYGHQQGDQALQQVATALSKLARRTDEEIARFGGEEFVLLVYADSREELEQLCTQVTNAIRILAIPHPDSDVSHRLTISMGAAWIHHGGPWLGFISAEEWLQLADQALYLAKNNGRNQYRVIDVASLRPAAGSDSADGDSADGNTADKGFAGRQSTSWPE